VEKWVWPALQEVGANGDADLLDFLKLRLQKFSRSADSHLANAVSVIHERCNNKMSGRLLLLLALVAHHSYRSARWHRALAKLAPARLSCCSLGQLWVVFAQRGRGVLALPGLAQERAG
jgi:hypothetical protein